MRENLCACATWSYSVSFLLIGIFEFGTRGSEVQILSPRPIYSIVYVALEFPWRLRCVAVCVDFGPYVKEIVHRVSDNWHKLVPAPSASKKGKLAIEVAIRKDGKLAEMCLVATSGDVALDRAAWRGITASNPFPALPTDFTGAYLAVRFRFYYNPE